MAGLDKLNFMLVTYHVYTIAGVQITRIQSISIIAVAIVASNSIVTELGAVINIP